MNRQLRGSIMLLITALIWGTGFVARKSGMDTISPIAFNGMRMMIGALTLLPVIAFMNRKSKGPRIESTPAEKEQQKKQRKLLFTGGVCCGLFLMAAGSFQQVGIYYTNAGKAGFITALYVVLVPIIGVFLKRKIRPIFWACVGASAVGLYLLCIPAGGGFSDVNKGDILVFCCAFLYAGHILCIDYFSPKVDSVKMSCIQFFVVGIVSFLLMFFIDPALGFSLPTLSDIHASWFELFYAGIMTCGVAYTFQVVAQADVNPTLASMLLCLESVFAVLASAIILKDPLGPREIIGCVFLFAAIVVAQLPGKKLKSDPHL